MSELIERQLHTISRELQETQATVKKIHRLIVGIIVTFVVLSLLSIAIPLLLVRLTAESMEKPPEERVQMTPR
jgi:hypothetical protein